jgi:SlyX protein
MMEERITELELRFMQQEHTLQELSDTVYRQEQTIVRLERELTVLTQQMRTVVSSNAGEADADERPPHY